MTAPSSPRGWCPSVFAPMAAADGLLVRVKPRRAMLPSGRARRIAEAVMRHGNGRIELTRRANLQVRGLTEAGCTAFARAMVACGAADADPAAERRRNIMVSPLAGVDPGIAGHPETVAAALEHALSQAADLALPDKFGFAVDGGGFLPLGNTGADITVRTGTDGCRVEIAGAARAIACAESPAAGVALDLARAFARLGGRRRMRDLVASVGEDAIYEAADALASDAANVDAAGACWPLGTSELDPERLIAAADLADARGDGLLRVTPWRRVLIATADADLFQAAA